MIKPSILFFAKATLAAFLMWSSLGPASAESCEQKARAAAAAKSGAQVLAVSTEGDKCVIQLLVREKDKPPRRETVVIKR